MKGEQLAREIAVVRGAGCPVAKHDEQYHGSIGELQASEAAAVARNGAVHAEVLWHGENHSISNLAHQGSKVGAKLTRGAVVARGFVDPASGAQFPSGAQTPGMIQRSDASLGFFAGFMSNCTSTLTTNFPSSPHPASPPKLSPKLPGLKRPPDLMDVCGGGHGICIRTSRKR